MCSVATRVELSVRAEGGAVCKLDARGAAPARPPPPPPNPHTRRQRKCDKKRTQSVPREMKSETVKGDSRRDNEDRRRVAARAHSAPVCVLICVCVCKQPFSARAPGACYDVAIILHTRVLHISLSK